MPGKPSRRDRRRRGSATERRPRPAPPVSPGRIVRTPRTGDATATRETETRADAPPTAAAPEQTPATSAQTGSRAASGQGRAQARGRGVGPLRRGATTSARALETQREERVRRDSVRDLRSIGLAAVITTIALIAAATLL